MKNLIKKLSYAICILLVAGFFAACTMGEFKPRIEQKVEKSTVACNEIQLTTLVWHKQIIVKAWYDPIATVDSTLVEKRYKQAQEVVKVLKACH
jgi:hypothetical protein